MCAEAVTILACPQRAAGVVAVVVEKDRASPLVGFFNVTIWVARADRTTSPTDDVAIRSRMPQIQTTDFLSRLCKIRCRSKGLDTPGVTQGNLSFTQAITASWNGTSQFVDASFLHL